MSEKNECIQCGEEVESGTYKNVPNDLQDFCSEDCEDKNDMDQLDKIEGII